MKNNRFSFRTTFLQRNRAISLTCSRAAMTRHRVAALATTINLEAATEDEELRRAQHPVVTIRASRYHG